MLREVFLWVLRFSPLLKNQHFQIPIRSGCRTSLWVQLPGQTWFWFLSKHVQDLPGLKSFVVVQCVRGISKIVHAKCHKIQRNKNLTWAFFIFFLKALTSMLLPSSEKLTRPTIFFLPDQQLTGHLTHSSYSKHINNYHCVVLEHIHTPPPNGRLSGLHPHPSVNSNLAPYLSLKPSLLPPPPHWSLPVHAELSSFLQLLFVEPIL